uniref:protein Wnt-5-like n=1 Tax=Styela clava TaxID=7725 RepID=UPI00193A6A9F|nr:protein Wnt-5-like [Styela clava]
MPSFYSACVVLIPVLLSTMVLSRNVHDRWWSVAQDSIRNMVQRNRSICQKVEGFTQYQKRWCKKNKAFIKFVIEGARQGISECKYQFRGDRWNCSTEEKKWIFYGKFLKYSGSRESAFAHAITAAGVVHAISQACATNSLPPESCPDDGLYSKFASELVKYFLNNKRHRRGLDRRLVMDDHNNKVGRMTVVNSSTKKCKCIDVPGKIEKCNKTFCWEEVEDFRVIGNVLREAYFNASQFWIPRDEIASGNLNTKLKTDLKSNTELVYFNSPPDFCYRVPRNNFYGTRSRECNATGSGYGSCEYLCCGYGYESKMFEVVELCNCDTQNKCFRCVRMEQRHLCK